MEYEKLKQALIEKLNEWSRKIIITGKVGIWKTYLAKELSRIAHQIVLPDLNEAERRYYFINDAQMKMQLMSWNLVLRSPECYMDPIERYPIEALVKMPVVVYDDLGSVELTPGFYDKMIYWINERNPLRVMIFTSNLSAEELFEKDSRLASRISENAIFAELTGHDRRKITVSHIS